MSIANDAPLRFGPAHHGSGPRGPALVFGSVGSRIGLILQIQQANVSHRLGTKAADLQIVFEQGEGVVPSQWFSRKKAPLKIKARSPGKHTAHVEPFSPDLKIHVRWLDTLSRRGVVSAPGSVNVMISRIKTVIRGLDPPMQGDIEGV